MNASALAPPAVISIFKDYGRQQVGISQGRGGTEIKKGPQRIKIAENGGAEGVR